MLWIIKEDNSDATSHYLYIIEQGLSEEYGKATYVETIGDIKSWNKNDYCLVMNPIDGIKALLRGYNNLIVWFQGVFAEESYLRRNSIIRKKILSIAENVLIKKSKILFFVSEAMVSYYSKRFKGQFIHNKSVIMPCYNTTINKSAFYEEKKYKQNWFVYAGSMSVWQSFYRTVSWYKSFEVLGLTDTKLLVLTREREEAERVLQAYGIENYEVTYVPIQRIGDYLKRVKYGFLLRDNHIVNNVATPTKLSTYMAYGIIPIVSQNLEGCSQVIDNTKYMYIEEGNLENFIKYNQQNMNPDNIFNEYNYIFRKNFNDAEYIENIKAIVERLYIK